MSHKRPHGDSIEKDSSKRVERDNVLTHGSIMPLGMMQLRYNQKKILALLLGLHPRTGVESCLMRNGVSNHILQSIKMHMEDTTIPYTTVIDGAYGQKVLDIYTGTCKEDHSTIVPQDTELPCLFEGMHIKNKHDDGTFFIINQHKNMVEVNGEPVEWIIINGTAFILCVEKLHIDGEEYAKLKQKSMVLIKTTGGNVSVQYWSQSASTDLTIKNIKRGNNCIIIMYKDKSVAVHKVDKDGNPCTDGTVIKSAHNPLACACMSGSCLCAFVVSNKKKKDWRHCAMVKTDHLKIIYVMDGTPLGIIERTFSVPGDVLVDTLDMGIISTFNGGLNITAIPGPSAQLRKDIREELEWNYSWNLMAYLESMSIQSLFNNTIIIRDRSPKFTLLHRSNDGITTKVILDATKHHTLLTSDGENPPSGTDFIKNIVGLDKERGIIAITLVNDKQETSTILYVHMHTGKVIAKEETWNEDTPTIHPLLYNI
jgi:hypothetical protein